MAVERVDYYSDEEYEMALAWQEQAEREWLEQQYAMEEVAAKEAEIEAETQENNG